MMKISETALIDANILVYAMNKSDERHSAAYELRRKAVLGEVPTVLTPQVLYEYFRVVTHPKILTIPLSVHEALDDIKTLSRALPMILPQTNHVELVISLLQNTHLSREYIYDVTLAATMLSNGVSYIYSYDRDFTKIPDIHCLQPENFL